MRLLGLNTQMQYNMGQTGVEQSGKLRDLLGKGVDTSGLQAWQTGKAPGQMAGQFAQVGGPQRAIAGQTVRQDQGPTDRGQIENAMMASYNRARAPSIRAEEAQLAARGLAPGSQGYGTMQQGREDAAGEAARQAYLASGAESRQAQEAYNQAAAQRFQQGAAQGQFANAAQQQAYEQAQQRAAFANQAVQGNYQMGQDYASFLNSLRGGQLQELMALRNQPLNEISALLSGSQVTVPQFQGYQSRGIESAPIGSYIGQNYANQANAAANFNQGLFGLGSAGLGAFGSWLGSDRRLKTDIEALEGQSFAGLPLYQFRYRADPDVLQVGVMSDDVRKLHPDAVSVDAAGFDMVDYGLLARRHNHG
jgi:hypothetical protein